MGTAKQVTSTNGQMVTSGVSCECAHWGLDVHTNGTVHFGRPRLRLSERILEWHGTAWHVYPTQYRMSTGIPDCPTVVLTFYMGDRTDEAVPTGHPTTLSERERLLRRGCPRSSHPDEDEENRKLCEMESLGLVLSTGLAPSKRYSDMSGTKQFIKLMLVSCSSAGVYFLVIFYSLITATAMRTVHILTFSRYF